MSLDGARELAYAGRFVDAFGALNKSSILPNERLASDLLRAEFLERTGKHGHALSLISSLTSKRLNPFDRSVCEFLLARIDYEAGNTDSALLHIQRSMALSSEGTDRSVRARALIWLMPLIAERSGSEALSPLVVEARKELTKLGDARLWASFHVFAAQTDVKRGLSRNARGHLRIATNLLEKAPNAWISAVLEGVQVGVGLLECDLVKAERHSRSALAFADESGVAASQRTALGNLAYVLFTSGHFDEALRVIERAFEAFPSAGSNHAAILDTEAQIKLFTGQLNECEALLAKVEETLRNPHDRVTYSYRGGAFTTTQLLLRRKKLAEAELAADLTIRLAKAASDHFLEKHATLVLAEIQILRGHSGANVIGQLSSLVGTLADEPLDLYAHYERVVACALAMNGELDTAGIHGTRAARVYNSVGNAPGLLGLSHSLEAIATPEETLETAGRHMHSPIASTSAVLGDVVSVLLHSGKPDLLAKELACLLNTLSVVHGASVVSRGDDAHTEIVTLGFGADHLAHPDVQRLNVSNSDDRSIEIAYLPKADIESVATINSIRLLLAAAQELDRGRAEREQTLTLWPVDDEAPSEDGFILLGTMAKLMTQAKRVAKANITVLITGESGTGKEVLARAVHKYSDRAAKPFVPFNCAAIPRDLVESHLFGHRRGAFTGADRDQPGIIRGARGGTIFLDEVGELSLDLQPKLLRFLESGEIAPLGEPGPSHVDVRVVAATNAKLETAVSEGRFREDLFYRLNVVRLDIPPLRERRDEIGALVNHFVTATALEFRKGFVRLAEETMEHFLVHRWPGNVRQLQNEVRRIVALADADSVIPPTVLAPEILNRHLLAPPPSAGCDLAIPVRDKLLPTLWRIEREMIKVALRDNGGRVEAAAKALGISRKGLYLKRQRLGL
jgi:DNA-binding NtrC family response regulator/tetratricopeptide (TPR) repeat protein